MWGNQDTKGNEEGTRGQRHPEGKNTGKGDEKKTLRGGRRGTASFLIIKGKIFASVKEKANTRDEAKTGMGKYRELRQKKRGPVLREEVRSENWKKNREKGRGKGGRSMEKKQFRC